MSKKQVEKIIATLRREMNGAVSESMESAGVRYGINYGVSLVTIKSIAQTIEKDNDLGYELLSLDIRETKLIAAYIADPSRLSLEDILKWSSAISTHEVAEVFSMSLFPKINGIFSAAFDWIKAKDPIIKNMGLRIIGKLHSDQNISSLNEIIQTIESKSIFYESCEAVNMAGIFALREIAKHNDQTNAKVKSLIKKLSESQNKNEQYVAQELSWQIV